ncbi:MAG: PEGA domain-containing protein [Akkermansia sp.]|nr:PEGA domain-containing protein [Akkermansia sp.]
MRNTFIPMSAICLALASCVSQKVFTIKTTPPGATVSINGNPITGQTPVSTKIREDKDLGIVVEKPGYQVESVTVNTKTSWWKSLLWTENDPRARYIEEDEITIPMVPLRTNSTYTPSTLTPFREPSDTRSPLHDSKAPALRDLPPM